MRGRGGRLVPARRGAGFSVSSRAPSSRMTRMTRTCSRQVPDSLSLLGRIVMPVRLDGPPGNHGAGRIGTDIGIDARRSGAGPRPGALHGPGAGTA